MVGRHRFETIAKAFRYGIPGAGTVTPHASRPDTVRVVDHCPVPMTRHAKDGAGDVSGEVFRTAVLAPRLREAVSTGRVLVVVLDGAAGYPACWIDEAFGGLRRADGFDAATLASHVVIESGEPWHKHHAMLARRSMATA